MIEKAGTALAIVVAAGAGRRLPSLVAKQFLDLAGEPLLVHAIRALEHSPSIDEILVLLPKSDVARFGGALARYDFSKIADVIAGGEERQDSVEQGLRWSRDRHPEMILVHDGVRPFVDNELIARVLAGARAHGAAIPGLRPAETVKRVREGFVLQTLDREELQLVQTPQAFRAEILWSAFDRARQTGLRGTDEAAIVEAFGQAVAVVEGSPTNLKITRKEDLRYAEMLLGAKTAKK